MRKLFQAVCKSIGKTCVDLATTYGCFYTVYR